MNLNNPLFDPNFPYNLNLQFSQTLLRYRSQIIDDHNLFGINRMEMMGSYGNFQNFGYNYKQLSEYQDNLRQNLPFCSVIHQNSANINCLSQTINNQSINGNLIPLSQIPKAIDQVQHKFDPNKIQNHKQFLRKNKRNQNPIIIVIDSEESAQKSQKYKSIMLQNQKNNTTNNASTNVTKNIKKTKKTKNKKIASKTKLKNSKKMANKTQQIKIIDNRLRKKNNIEKTKPKICIKKKVTKKKHKTKAKNKKKQKQLKNNQKKVKIQFNQYETQFNQNGLTKHIIMTGKQFQVQIPQFIFNQRLMNQLIQSKRNDIRSRLIQKKQMSTSQKIQIQNNYLQENKRSVNTIILENGNEIGNTQGQFSIEMRSSNKEESRSVLFERRMTRRGQKLNLRVY